MTVVCRVPGYLKELLHDENARCTYDSVPCSFPLIPPTTKKRGGGGADFTNKTKVTALSYPAREKTIHELPNLNVCYTCYDCEYQIRTIHIEHVTKLYAII